ncbi:MAG: 2-dehydro-3-deoxygalactonokinase [Alphaproteobacteria bacterium]|nr:MAG: 2-dehydro-3-deoxygalactonokinase [Alphaproteobacteria bacterium]
MRQDMFIAGDWGTSNLRLFLMDGGALRDRAQGPGVSIAMESPAAVLAHATAHWRASHGPLPVLLCGMIGSSIGWVETPYLPCPVGYAELDGLLTRFVADGQPVAIIPGLSTVNPLGAPDFMRGEETQIFGALTNRPALQTGTHFLCLPGTHAKWVLIKDGRIETFLTALSGELYALLRRHSVIARGAEALDPVDEEAFRAGVARSLAPASGSFLLHQLFEARARQLDGSYGKPQAVSFLSGLVIGHDVAGALQIFTPLLAGQKHVTLVGASALSQLYGAALAQHGWQSVALDGDAQSLAGLCAVADAVMIGETGHAA